MKGNCADLHLGGAVNCRALRHRAGRRAHFPERNGAGRYVAGDADQGEAPTLPCKAGFGGLSDDTAAGTVARHNGPVERAGWRVATGRA